MTLLFLAKAFDFLDKRCDLGGKCMQQFSTSQSRKRLARSDNKIPAPGYQKSRSGVLKLQLLGTKSSDSEF